MRKLAVVLGVLLLIGGVLLVIAILSLNRIIAHNRERIVQRVETALGRQVRVERITVSLWPGIGVRLQELGVADDPQFGDEVFLRAASVTARAQLWPLLRGDLEVNRVDVRQPQIHLIRNAVGMWNYSTLKPLQPAASAAAPLRVQPVAYVAAASPAVSAPLPLSISRATIVAGTLVVTDHTQEPARTTRVTHVELAANDISVSTPIRVDLEAAVQGDASNVRVRGTIGPLQTRPAIPIELTGDLGPFGPRKTRFDDLHVKAAVSADSVRATQLAGRAFDGSFTLAGQYPLRSTGQFTLKGELTNITVAKVLQLTMADAAKRIEGAARLTLDLRATGNSAETIQSTLAGNVVADVTGGALKDFNLVNEVLGRATGLPGIGNLVSNAVKPKYGRLFSDTDTRFEKLHGSFQLANQRMQTDDLALIATDYGARASGWIGFDRQIDLSGTLSMSRQFTSDVVADVKEVKYVVDDTGELAVPFRLRGRIGEAKPRPDMTYLAQRLTRGLTQGGAKDLLERLLGDKPKQPGRSGEEERKSIERGLRNLFGR